MLKNSAIILGYHGVTDGAVPLENWIQMKATLFEEHIRYLAGSFRCVTFSQLLKELYSNKIIPKTVCVTFDDGYANNFLHAFPILGKYRVPATIFLTAGLINTKKLLWHDLVLCAIASTSKSEIVFKSAALPLRSKKNKEEFYRYFIDKYKYTSIHQQRKITRQLADALDVNLDEIMPNGNFLEYRLLDWEEIKEMKQSGLIEFGSHTVNHSILSQLSIEEAQSEIRSSKEILEQYVGQVSSFSYANGTERDFNESHIQIIKSLNYSGAVTTIHGRVSASDNPFKLHRYCIGSEYKTEDLDYLLHTIHK